MGTAYEAAAGVTRGFEARDYDAVRSWLADDFTFNDPYSPAPPMNADQWIAANRTMHQAFPDMSMNFEILEEDGNQVWVRARITGTHTGDWDLSMMGGGVVPATNQRVETSESVTRGVINADGKVTSIEIVEADEDAGVPGVMQQLGIEMGG